MVCVCVCSVCVRARECIRACVRACLPSLCARVHVCARACVRACVIVCAFPVHTGYLRLYSRTVMNTFPYIPCYVVDFRIVILS